MVQKYSAEDIVHRTETSSFVHSVCTKIIMEGYKCSTNGTKKNNNSRIIREEGEEE